jgi:hypothetical protein
MKQYFPYDGRRMATYYGDPTGTLVAELIEPIDEVDDVELATFTYTIDGELAAAVQWASDDDGIRIAGAAGETGEVGTYDPPIQLAFDRMQIGDCIATTTGDATYTSTFVGIEDIVVQWGMEWEGAVHFSLTSDDADAFFLGDYWLVTRYGPGWMDLGGTFWDLKYYEYEW